MSKVATITSTGELVGDSCTVYGLHYRSTGTEGSIVLKSGGASGTTIATINTPALEGHLFLEFGGGGLRFATDCHGTLTNVDSASVIYDD